MRGVWPICGPSAKIAGYVVTEITQSAGPAAISGPAIPLVVTAYEYDAAGPVWAQPTNPLIPAADRLWSDFRGFPSVTTKVGSGTEQTRTSSSYFLGVDGRSLSADLDGDGAQAAIPATDAEAFNGQVFQSSTYNGAVPVSSSVNVPQVSDPSARHTVAGQEVLARRIASTTSWGAVYGTDGVPDHITRATTTFDEFAQLDTVDDSGDVTDPGDDVCTDATYARNLDAWLTGAASRTLVYSAPCATTPSLPADLVTDSRVHFDDGGFGAAPTRGLATRTETINPATGTGYATVMTAAYDSLGRATSSTDALGRTSTTTYTPLGAGVPASATAKSADPDGTGPLTAHETIIDLHPLLGVPVGSTDPNGRITTASYDSLGRRIAVWTPERQGKSPAATYEYTVSHTGVNSVLTRIIGADGATCHASSQVYDALLRPVQAQAESADARHRVVQNGQVVETGRIISDTRYDSVGRVAAVTGAWYAHGSPSGAWVEATVVAPSTTTYVYDGAGRATDQILWAGNTSNTEYEKWRTTTHYDGATTLVIPPDGGVPTATTVDARGRTRTLSQYLRDPRLNADADTAAEVLALAHQDTTYAYDHAGRLASVTDPEANTWSYGYDYAGRQVSANDPDNGLSSTEFDLAGQVLSTTDATGTTLAYQYDALGRRTATREGSATGPVRSAWVHDVLTDASGTPLATAGSVVRGLTTASIRYATPGDAATAHVTSVTGYDTGYRPLGSVVRVPAGTLGDGVPTTYETKYGYTSGGAADRVTLPEVKSGGGGTVLGAEMVTTYYDAASVPSWMSGGFGWGTYVAASVTSAFGQPLLADLGTTYGAVVSWKYDDVTGRLTNLALDRERINGTDLALSYSYDDAGNVLSVKDQPTAAARAGQQWQDNQCFTYDALRRLTHAWTAYLADNCALAPEQVTPAHVGGAAPYRHDYAYDPLGNRTSLTEHATDGSATTTVTDYKLGAGLNSPDPELAAGPHAVVAATRSSGGQTVESLSYEFDDAGRTTGTTTAAGATESSRDLDWDAEGELASVTSTTGAEQDTARYVYTADGDRLLRVDETGTTLYLRGGQEIISQNGTVTATRHYSFGGQAVAVRTGAGLGKVTSLVCDHHGTTVAAVPNTEWTPTSVERMYTDPFGGVRGDSNDVTVPGDKQFLNKTRDSATRYTLIGARYYDETLGRFLTVDPVMDLADPQQWNAYAYSNNNPLTWTDPTGLRPAYIDGSGGGTFTPIATPPSVSNPALQRTIDSIYLRQGAVSHVGDGKAGTALLSEFTTGVPVNGKWHIERVSARLSSLTTFINSGDLSPADQEIAMREADELWRALDADDKAGKVTQYVQGNKDVEDAEKSG